MKFRNYCLVVMGNTKDVLLEVIKVSETKPNTLDAKGIFITTFTSNIEPRELTDFFRLNKRTFLLFDLNSENSGFFFSKKEIHEGLFGFLRDMGDDDLRQKTEDLIAEISSTTVNNGSIRTKNKKAPEDEISMKDIKKMTPDEKNELTNKLIDKGVDNLSETDIKLLNMLSM